MTISPVSRRKKRGVFSKRDLCRRCQKEYQPKEHSSDSFSALCLGRGKPKSVGGGKEPSFEVSSSSSSSRCCCCCSSIESADKLKRSRERSLFFATVSFYEKKSLGFFLKSALASWTVFLKRTPAGGWNIYIRRVLIFDFLYRILQRCVPSLRSIHALRLMSRNSSSTTRRWALRFSLLSSCARGWLWFWLWWLFFSVMLTVLCEVVVECGRRRGRRGWKKRNKYRSWRKNRKNSSRKWKPR